METLLAEQANLEKRGNLGKTINDVQNIVDLLVNARNSIASDPSSSSSPSQPHAMANLTTSVKKSFEKVNGDLKEVYSALNKYSKALDKKFKPVNLPSANNDPLASQQDLINRAIAMHLLREGQFAVASTFIAEANSKPQRPDVPLSSSSLDAARDITMVDSPPLWTVDFTGADPMHDNDSQDETLSCEGAGALQRKFSEMYNLLHALRNKHDLEPVIQWARQHSNALELRGSNLEFELCRLRFVELYTSDPGADNSDAMTDGAPVGVGNIQGPLRALEYARQTFPLFSARYMRETASLLGSLAYAPNLTTSPYKNVFYDCDAWEDVARSFVREFCGMLGLSEQSPLYTAVTAGSIALPVLEKLERVMGEVGGQWTSVNELPVEIPLPPSYLFHSIFVCPVSKEQATDANPPMMLPCGHVIAKESLEKISRGNKRFKCPYCPAESYPRDAKKVLL